jgi:hypothetical protein
MITAPLPVTRQILPVTRQILPMDSKEQWRGLLPIRAKPLSSGKKVIGQRRTAPATKRKRHAEDE